MSERSLAQWLEYIETVHHRSIDLELERVDEVLKKLLPTAMPFIIVSIAGTNGKGSTVAMLGAVLEASGARVGSYTSPHLVHYNERFQINHQSVTDQEICAVLSEIETARRHIPLTYFEFSTLAALKLFVDHEVDVALLEVGMGGRLDAVNVVAADAAVVTSVDLDHQYWLGQDRETIAVEKAGIFKPGRVAVCADPDPPANIAAVAAEVGAELYQLDRDFWFETDSKEWSWVSQRSRIDGLPLPPIEGTHQLYNAAAVVMVLTVLADRLPWSREHLRTGIARTHLPGRWQRLGTKPEVIVDVAHNAAATRTIANSLGELVVSGRTLAVCAMLRDKAVAAVVANLIPLVDCWYLGTIDNERGATSRELALEIDPLLTTSQKSMQFDTVVEAFVAACSDAGADDRVLVFGSFHTVGDIMRHLDS